MCPLTVIILTFNEESNLGAALDSVHGWAPEVFVVDSYSTDRTVEIALARAGDGVQVVQHAFENYSAQWNWALTHLPVSQPWVLKLDADERAPEAFRAEVARRISDPRTDEVAFVLHRRLIFMGRWLRWGGLYPNGHMHLWRAGRAHFERREVNEHPIVEGKVGEITDPFDHLDFKDLTHWIDRHNRYASMEARSLIRNNMLGEVRPRLLGRPDERRMWMRALYYKVPARPFFYFLYRYVARLGFLDGRVGFRFAFLHSAYLCWIDLKVCEYRATGRIPEVVWPTRGRPHPAVAASELQRAVDSVSTAPEKAFSL
jgi:glycosyltransferase involved in cell wall biosynthesis